MNEVYLAMKWKCIIKK